MAETFVDLGYRGLVIGKRAKLAQVRPSTGYVETMAPLPVGSAITLACDDGVAIEARVLAVHEVATAERPPGMLVRPKLDGAAAAWWKTRVELPDLAKATIPGVVATVVPKSRDDAAPDLVDDGRNTAVNEIPAEALAALDASRDSNPNLVDDGKKTMMMEAVDLEALGLSASSGSLPAVKDDDGDDKAAKKKKKKRRTTQSDA